MLTDDELRERRAVEIEIIRQCREWGILLTKIGPRLMYHPSARMTNSNLLPIHGEVSYNTRDLIMYIIYEPDCAADIVWWTFLHEMGHVHQWLELSEYTFDALYAYRTKSMELDAWLRAEEMARSTKYPPCFRFYKFRREALETYGVKFR